MKKIIIFIFVFLLILITSCVTYYIAVHKISLNNVSFSDAGNIPEKSINIKYLNKNELTQIFKYSIFNNSNDNIKIDPYVMVFKIYITNQYRKNIYINMKKIFLTYENKTNYLYSYNDFFNKYPGITYQSYKYKYFFSDNKKLISKNYLILPKNKIFTGYFIFDKIPEDVSNFKIILNNIFLLDSGKQTDTKKISGKKAYF